MHLVRIAILALAAVPISALACSCMTPDMLPPHQLRAMIAEFPYIVRARIAATERPLACRVVPLRWAYAAAGARASVRHVLSVRQIIRGAPLGDVVVIQQMGVDFGGCQPAGSPACDPEYGAEEDVWVLRRSGGAFERAPMCTQGIIREALRI